MLVPLRVAGVKASGPLDERLRQLGQLVLLGGGHDHRGGNQPADGRPAGASRTACISW